MKRTLAGVVAVALALLVGPNGVAKATGGAAYVTATTGHLLNGGDEVQVPVTYECQAGILPQIFLEVVDSAGNFAAPGGDAEDPAFAIPEVPICTGGPQTYVVTPEAAVVALVAGAGTYTATLSYATTTLAPGFPGAVIYSSGAPAPIALDNHTPIQSAAPGPVTATGSTATDTTITLNWGPPVNDGGAAVAAYRVTCRPDSTTVEPPADCAAGTVAGWTRATFTGLAPKALYDFSITAVNYAGDSPAVAVQASTSPPVVIPLACSVWMSNPHPKDGSTTYVEVRTAAFAYLTAVVHYGQGRTRHSTANGAGRAAVAYRVGRARPGRRVAVSVTESLDRRVGYCTTSFTPRR